MPSEGGCEDFAPSSPVSVLSHRFARAFVSGVSCDDGGAAVMYTVRRSSGLGSEGEFGMPNIWPFGQIDCSNPASWLLFAGCWQHSPAEWGSQIQSVSAPSEVAPLDTGAITVATGGGTVAPTSEQVQAESNAQILATQAQNQTFFSNLASTICNGQPANADGSCPAATPADSGLGLMFWIVAAVAVGAVVVAASGARR